MPKLEWAGHKWLITSGDNQMRLVLCCGTVALQTKRGKYFHDLAFGSVQDNVSIAWTREYELLTSMVALQALDLFRQGNAIRKSQTQTGAN